MSTFFYKQKVNNYNFLIVNISQVIFVQCQFPGYGQHVPYPVYIGNNDDDDWHCILPILLLLLADGGFGGGYGGYGGWGGGYGGGCGGCNGCCNCNSGSNTVPIPYPIPIPVNTPVVNC